MIIDEPIHPIIAVVESGDVNSYVDRPDSKLSDLLRRLIDIAAQ